MSFYKEVPGKKTTLESTLKFDLAPTAGSTNPVTSGGVAETLGEVIGGSKIAPTTGTRPSVEGDFVNKMIVVDGKVAKITDVQDGTTTYVTTDIVDELNAMQWKDVVIPPLLEAPYTVPVHNHEHVVVSYIAGSNIDLTIQCDEKCDEATVTIQANPTDMQSVVIKHGTSNMKVFGRKTLVGIDATRFDYNYLYSSESSLPPTDFSEIAVSSPPPLEDVKGVTGDKASENHFAIEIKKNYAVVHYV